MKKVLSKVQKVRAISAYQRNYESLLDRTDNLTNRMMKSFDSPDAKFSATQVKRICANLEEVANKVASGLKGCFTNLRVAIATEVPTDRIVAHVEDAHTLLSKIAILKAQAIASIAADEDITMDESGQLVEEAPVEEAPVEEAPEEEEKSPEELAQDIHDDLDQLVQELTGEAPAEDSEEEDVEAEPEKVAAAKKSPKAEVNPDMPTSNKDNPKAEEPKDVLKLQDNYEHAPTNKNAKKKSAAEEVEAEMNEDMPTSNPEMDEESLEELVEEYEASPSDPENLEMEDSMIDDAVNVEILSDGDVDTMEEEVVKSSASLKSRKLASSKRSASDVSEDDIMSKILSESMF